MQKKLSLPLNAPVIFYQKEWMSLGDYFGYAGSGGNQHILNRIDLVFLNNTLFRDSNGKGVERIILCTATRYSDSVWLEEWRVVPYDEKNYTNDGRRLKHDAFEQSLRNLLVPIPTSAYYINDVYDFKTLTYRVLKVVYGHSHNFRTLRYYQG